MKNVFVIVFLLLSIPMCAQRKISGMTEASSAAGTAEIPMIYGGANYRISKANFQSELSDSITFHRNDINYLLSRADVQEMDIDSAVVPSASADSLIIYYDTQVAGSADTTLFKIYAAESALGSPESATIQGSTVRLLLPQSILAYQSVRLDYTQPVSGGITDILGYQAPSENNYNVTNRVQDVPSTAVLVSGLNFEQNLYDITETYTWDGSTSLPYVLGGVEGSRSVNFDAIANYAEMNESIDLGSTFSLSIVSLKYGYGDHEWCTLIEGDEFAVICDMVNNRYGFATWNGSDTAYAWTSDSAYVSSAYQMVTVAANRTTGYARMFVNGAKITEDSTIRTDFDSNGTIRLGLNKSDTLSWFGYGDFYRAYTGILTNGEIADLAASVGLAPIIPDYDAAVLDTAITNGTTTQLWFTKDLDGQATIVDTAAFDVTEGGSQLEMTSNAWIYDNGVTLVHEEASGGAIVVSYTKTGVANLRDLDLNEVANFSESARNDTPVEDFYPDAWYSYENVTDDNTPNERDGTSNNLNYSTTQKAGGTYAAYEPSGNDNMITPAWTRGPQWSIHFPVFTWGASAELFTTQSVDIDGFTVTMASGRVWVETHDGSNKVTARSTSGHTLSGQWVYIGIAFDEDADTLAIYIDGQFATESGYNSIDNDFPSNEAVYLGGANYITWIWGYWDETQFYHGLMTPSYATDLYNAPADTVSSRGGGGVTPPPNPDPGQYIIYASQDFDHHTGVPKEYTTDIWNPDFNNPGWRDSDHQAPQWFADNIADSIVYDPVMESNALKFNFTDHYEYWDYYGGEIGGWSPGRGGDYWKWSFGEELKEVYISYRVRFRPGFDPVEGGKLPAFNGGSPMSNMQANNLDQPATGDGFTTALMFKDYGGIAFYLFYHNMRAERYGDTFLWAINSGVPAGLDYDDAGRVLLDFTNGEEHVITIRVVINTTTSSSASTDGFVEGFIDGILAGRATDIQWIGAWDYLLGVNQIAFGCFFGGTGNQFSPTANEWVIIDDFTIWNFAAGVDGVPYSRELWTAADLLDGPVK